MGRKAPASPASASQSFISPPRRFLNMAARRGSAPAYYVRDDTDWAPTSWNAYRDEVRRAARALVALGVKRGDTIAVFGYNKPEWAVMDLAAMMIGASVAGIYFTSSARDAAYIINHSQCEIVLAEKQEHFQKITKERAQLNVLRHVVMMKGAAADDPLQMTWEGFLSHGGDSFDPEVERRLRSHHARGHRLSHLHVGYDWSAEGGSAQPRRVDRDSRASSSSFGRCRNETACSRIFRWRISPSA